jgi:ribosome-associated protein
LLRERRACRAIESDLDLLLGHRAVHQLGQTYRDQKPGAGQRRRGLGGGEFMPNRPAQQRERNREDALARMQELLDEASKPPPPKRRKTKPTKGSQIRRMDSKTKRGTTKKLRTGPISD